MIELKICELAQTPQETASHKRLRTSPSPSPKSGNEHLLARRLEAEFNPSKASDTVAYESPIQKLLKNLSKKSRMLNKLLQRNNTRYLSSRVASRNNTRYLSSRVASSRLELAIARNQCVRIATIRGNTKLCVRLHPVLLLR